MSAITESFEPGLPINAGNGISMQSFGTGFESEAEVSGYFVPAAAVE